MFIQIKQTKKITVEMSSLLKIWAMEDFLKEYWNEKSSESIESLIPLINSNSKTY